MKRHDPLGTSNIHCQISFVSQKFGSMASNAHFVAVTVPLERTPKEKIGYISYCANALMTNVLSLKEMTYHVAYTGTLVHIRIDIPMLHSVVLAR